MATASAFILPLRGLGQGTHAYTLKLDDAFFAEVPDSAVDGGDLDLNVEVDRRSREVVIDFELKGTVNTACDRCLAAIDLPVDDRRRLIVKLSPEATEQVDEGDIVYVHPETSEFNLAPFAYELTVLALPMIKVYDCREGAPPYPCDEETLDRIAATEEASTKAEDAPSPWDVLKNLNNN